MEGDLRKLIDDPRFRKYHRELLKPREFNTFDVLRYADYEIRHSNVLAWLLRPADTHGIGGLFLKWFVNHVNERLGAANVGPLPATDFEAANVVVRRELDHVDITVFFKRERCLIAIENKTGPASSDHFDQVTGYQRKLRGKYEDHTVKSVLLTTSPDGSGDRSGIAHVGWESVHEAIGSFHAAGEFPSCGVRAFVRQYLDLVERWVRPTGVEGFKTLLDDYRSILKKMRRILEKDGDDGVGAMVPEDRTDYRDALIRLVKESRQNPKQLRRAVADYLKGRGCTTWTSHNPRLTHYWLTWTDTNLAETAQSLGGKDDSLRWGMTFTYHGVRAGFYLDQRPREEREEHSPLDRLKDFMHATPINRQEPDKYPMTNNGFGWLQVYDQEILSNDELADMSGSEGNDEVLRRLKDFMGSDKSEHRRIDDYFQCLAFRPDDSVSMREDSP